jgi:FtsZ-interacting cell division protein YlmF
MQDILIVVDMQNDFIDGALGTAEAVEIVPRVAEKIRSFPGKVLFTRDTHPENYLETQEGQNLPVEHCIEGTEGWQIRSSLASLIPSGHIYNKPTFGCLELAGEIQAITMYDEDVEIEVERERVPKRSKPKFVPTRRSSSSNRGERVDEMYNIHRMHAKTIDDGKQITELLKNRTTVIINLEGVDLAIAQRIIDYTSGSCFALDAKLESISSYIFMASPSSANVTADITGENVSSIDVPGTDGSDYL